MGNILRCCLGNRLYLHYSTTQFDTSDLWRQLVSCSVTRPFFSLQKGAACETIFLPICLSTAGPTPLQRFSNPSSFTVYKYREVYYIIKVDLKQHMWRPRTEIKLNSATYFKHITCYRSVASFPGFPASEHEHAKEEGKRREEGGKREGRGREGGRKRKRRGGRGREGERRREKGRGKG